MVDIFDLRSALTFLENNGIDVQECDDTLKPEQQVAAHYARNIASVPASSIGREEMPILYNNVVGHESSVLMGLFGSRKINRMLLTGGDNCHRAAFGRALQKPITPHWMSNPPCQEVSVTTEVNLLNQLPVLTLTDQDAGPFITLGLVMVTDPDSGKINTSIHRLCVQDEHTLSIAIYPGRHLGKLYQAAVEKGETLPISINIGCDPAVYFASCLTEPVCQYGDCELDVVGGLREQAVRISPCMTVKAACLSHAEFVLEAEITSEYIAENQHNPTKGSMPEFLGYQGQIEPNQKVPKVNVKAITHRDKPIYHTLLGPGAEQSELQSITPEMVSLQLLQANFELTVKDFVYNTWGGGLLMAVMQISKDSIEDDETAVQAALHVLETIPPLKHVFLIDDDVDPYSSEDILWAMTTRFQSNQNVHKVAVNRPFKMDPSQTDSYFIESGSKAECSKVLFDCTVPWKLKDTLFQRSFH